MRLFPGSANRVVCQEVCCNEAEWTGRSQVSMVRTERHHKNLMPMSDCRPFLCIPGATMTLLLV